MPEERPDELGYHLVHRLGRRGAWRPILGVVLLVVGLFVLSPLLWQLPYVAWMLATGRSVGEGMDRLLDLENPTPAGLAYVNVVLASAIPITWLLTRWLHGLRPGWLASVAGRIRWRFLLACVGISVVALVATVVVSAFVPQPAGAEIGAEPNPFTSTTRDFLLVILLLTPLQAAGEEYAFRGYLQQAFGGLFGSRVFAVGLSSLLFALAHGLGQSWPVFVDRLAFGLVAGALVILTGGLEAGIAMHVLNNWLAFGLALAFTDMASTLNPTGGTWWSLPGTLTQSLVYLVLATWTARRMGLSSTVSRGVLEGPRRSV
ncbi:CPBP family intramembrane glutamic endopeptidase [Nocardioides sp. Soil805]|uniref:CPBP family intramembrane glutamic endopeptidase n=1 Tax=Nocardioides sp. Soil805 TaxID=1736416 RepID=UPI0007025720|nr:type II CAAX endopeptidase family protein [Nocardioides sp. Soil805]KRF36456.1 abortive infection protein [Nocardioides sp. Soil805]